MLVNCFIRRSFDRLFWNQTYAKQNTNNTLQSIPIIPNQMSNWNLVKKENDAEDFLICHFRAVFSKSYRIGKQ